MTSNNLETNLISFACEIDEKIDVKEILETLPPWRTIIKEIKMLDESENSDSSNIPLMQLRFITAATDVPKIKDWLNDLHEMTSAIYSIKSTENCDGRYVDFKQRLYCHHKTKCSRVYDGTPQSRTRNTNCPSKLYIKLHSVKRKYRGKQKEKAPNPEMPCEIVFVITHNHSLNSADALRFHPVSDGVREKLLDLYQDGHTPSTALEALKCEIRLNFEDYDTILSDRKYCPDYMYCYHLYNKEFKKNWLEPVLSSEATFEPIKTDDEDSRDMFLNNAESDMFVTSTTISKDDIVSRGKEIVEEISDKLHSFLENSQTSDVVDGLEKLNDKLDVLHPEHFLSACTAFASGEKYMQNTKSTTMSDCQTPTSVSCQKTPISGDVVDEQLHKIQGGIIKKESQNVTRKISVYILENNKIKKSILEVQEIPLTNRIFFR